MNLTRRKFFSLAPAVAGTVVLGALALKETSVKTAPLLMYPAVHEPISEATLIAAQRVVDPPAMPATEVAERKEAFIRSVDRVFRNLTSSAP